MLWNRLQTPQTKLSSTHRPPFPPLAPLGWDFLSFHPWVMHGQALLSHAKPSLACSLEETKRYCDKLCGWCPSCCRKCSLPTWESWSLHFAHSSGDLLGSGEDRNQSSKLSSLSAVKHKLSWGLCSQPVVFSFLPLFEQACDSSRRCFWESFYLGYLAHKHRALRLCSSSKRLWFNQADK